MKWYDHLLEMALKILTTRGEKGMTQVLNSPWDVCFELVNEIIYIAMAGQPPIWKHDTKDGATRIFSGDGFGRNLNGSSEELWFVVGWLGHRWWATRRSADHGGGSDIDWIMVGSEDL